MGTHAAALPKSGKPPIFGPLLWPNGWMHQDATWFRGWPQPTRHCVRWGPRSPPLKVHSPPQFLANVRCGQTAGWTKMPLGMEVGLGPGRFCVQWGPICPQKKAHPPQPIFGPCLLWPNSCMNEDATWYGSRPRPRPHPHCKMGSQLLAKGAQQSLSFRPMSIVATVAHLSYC